MTIGLDLSSLQGSHRMRGIGYTLINFINNIPPDLRKKHDFVFFYYIEGNRDDPLELFDLNDINYVVRPLVDPKKIGPVLPGKFNLIVKFINKLVSLRYLYFGDARIHDVKGIDVFLQTDQMIGVPKGWGMKKVFIAYDVIPYVLGSDYLWDYKTSRSRGQPRQAAVRCSLRRWSYIHKLRVNATRSDKVIAISETTRKDFLKYVRSSRRKIVTIPLGVNRPEEAIGNARTEMHRYIDTSWGYLKRPFKMDEATKFLLFVGGADHRRKLDELVMAFNHLRAQGHELKLVLAGDIMRGPESIPVHDTQLALRNSSYADDIIYLGFVSDQERNWLYNNALVFVFPSRYEGFGLPVLEAMQYGTPVITYKNSSIAEAAGSAALYADSYLDIVKFVQDLESNPKLRKKYASLGKKQASNFTWEETSNRIMDVITAR